MKSSRRPAGRLGTLIALTAGGLAAVVLAGTPAQAHNADPHRFRLGNYVLSGPVSFYDEPDGNARQQAAIYDAEGRTADAQAMRALADVPEAIWFSQGTPAEVETKVKAVVKAAERKRKVPVLVAYNVPGRDCSQYSAGGAANQAEYEAWINGFARGIGNRTAVVILEPDGTALLSSEPWCEEGGGGSDLTPPEDFTLVDERFAELNYAIDRLNQGRRTAVYVDAGHSAWQQLNDYDAGYGEPSAQLGIVNRLIRAGIHKAAGFSLNVSNYRTDVDLVAYGTNVSKCLYFRKQTGAASCTDADIAGVTAPSWALTHFVLDTSRNGQGPWTAPAGLYPDPQEWCNPPGRGLGATPTTRTGNKLVDAFLWIKRPGESDGSCTRGTAGPTDPEYGIVDPAAGQWWPDYALGLIRNANPALPGA